MTYFCLLLLFWSAGQSGDNVAGTDHEEYEQVSDRIWRLTYPLTDMTTHALYQLQVDWYAAEDSTVLRLMDGAVALDSLVNYDFRGKEFEEMLDSHFVHLAFRQRCGLDCARSTSYVLAARQQKLYKALALTSYAEARQTAMWGVESEDGKPIPMDEHELYTVTLLLDTHDGSYGLLADENYESAGEVLYQNTNKRVRHYLRFDEEHMVFTNSTTQLNGEYEVFSLSASYSTFHQHFQEQQVPAATFHYQQQVYLGGNRWYSTYDIWQQLREETPKLLEQ